MLKKTDFCKVVELTSEEIECRKARYRTIIAQHLKEHFSEFKNINEYVLLKTDCPYPEEMSQKSHVITFPVLMKDEKSIHTVLMCGIHVRIGYTHFNIIPYYSQLLMVLMKPPVLRTHFFLVVLWPLHQISQTPT